MVTTALDTAAAAAPLEASARALRWTVMVFFFYVPNLIVVEALIRAPRASLTAAAKWATSAAFTGATLFLVLGTYYFTRFSWGPAILARIGL